MALTDDTPQRTVQKIFSRSFVFGFLAFFAFLSAYHSLVPTLPLYLVSLGSDEREVGVLVGVVAVASLVSRLLVGGALLRYSEKSVMVIGAVLSVLSFLAYTVFHPFWPFFVARLLQGLSFACVDTAVLAVVVNVTPAKYRGQAIGYILLVPPLSMAIAASVGVFLSNRFGFQTLFLSCVGLSLCALLFSLMVKGRKTGEQDKTASTRGSRLLDLSIVVPGVVTFINYFVGGAMFAFIPLYAVNCGVKNPGIFFSTVAVVLLLGRTLGGRILAGLDKEKIIRTFLFSLAAALMVLPFSRTSSMFILVGLLWGIGLAFVIPSTMAYALEYAGSSGGTALGTYQMFMDLGTSTGPVVAGLVVSLTGYRVMFSFLALIALMNIGYFHFVVRRRRKRR
jgi:predicted MFS family arabinose efflux permease